MKAKQTTKRSYKSSKQTKKHAYMTAKQTISQENAFWVTIGSAYRFQVPKAIVQYIDIHKGDNIQINVLKIQRKGTTINV